MEAKNQTQRQVACSKVVVHDDGQRRAARLLEETEAAFVPALLPKSKSVRASYHRVTYYFPSPIASKLSCDHISRARSRKVKTMSFKLIKTKKA
jgi:hypothetical protein